MERQDYISSVNQGQGTSFPCLFIVGGAVLKALDFVLLLRKLPLDLFFLRLQLLNSFLVHDFNLLTDRWVEKDRLRFR